jgi:hypothetical protein
MLRENDDLISIKYLMKVHILQTPSTFTMQGFRIRSEMLRTEITLMISKIGPELEDLFTRISSPQSRKAALSLFTATSQELASTYQIEDSSLPVQRTHLDAQPSSSSHSD